jgi:hypothetical protein
MAHHSAGQNATAQPLSVTPMTRCVCQTAHALRLGKWRPRNDARRADYKYKRSVKIRVYARDKTCKEKNSEIVLTKFRMEWGKQELVCLSSVSVPESAP